MNWKSLAILLIFLSGFVRAAHAAPPPGFIKLYNDDVVIQKRQKLNCEETTGGITCSDDATNATMDLSLKDCNANQVLKRNAGDTAWECAADATSAGGGNSIFFEHAGSAVGDNDSADITLDATTALSLTCVGNDCTLLVDDASATAKGAVELATTAETTTGTSTTLAVTPDGLKDGYQGSANVTTLGTIGTGTWQGTAIDHERGGLEADVSAYAGLIRIDSGSTTNVTDLSGLNTALGSSIADGAHTTDTNLTQEEVEDYAGALVAAGTGTHTGIAITYQDATGDMDFVVDHDAASNFEAGEHFTQANITTTGTVTTGTWSSDLAADTVDAITEIAASLKSGSDLTLVTGTKGTSGTCAEWNADGDLVEAASAAACGSGGSGDNVAINGVGADTTADFVDSIYLDFDVADGGAGGPDDVTGTFNYNAATGDHALGANELAFAANGFVVEGATADTIETYVQFGDPVSSDKTITFFNATDTVVGRDTTDTLTNKTIDSDNNTLSNIAISETKLVAGAGLSLSTDTLATDSSEADFLAKGALTCGASTGGKMQVHTTPLQYCDNAGTPALQYAAYGDSSGNATGVACSGSCISDAEVDDNITASSYLPLSGGTLTGEVTVDDLGLEFTAGDTLTDCSTFSATGGGIFYDDSEGIFKKCQDNTLTDLDTTAAGSGDAITVNTSGTVDTTGNLLDGGIKWTLTDGGAGGPDDITGTINFGTAFPGTPATGDVFAVTDDSAVGECDSNAGSALTLCRYNGSTWEALGDGGGGGADTNSVRDFFFACSSLEPLEPADSIPPLAKNTGTDFDYFSCDFNDSADEGRTTPPFVIPEDVDTGTDPTFLWSWSAAATTGTVNWYAVCSDSGADSEAIDFGTTTTITATAETVDGTANDRNRTTATETFANLGWAAGDIIRCKVYRDGNHATEDTMTGDAKLEGFGVMGLDRS